MKPAAPPPAFMPVYVEGGRFGGRDLITAVIGCDLAPLLALGWRFPRTVGREVEGGGVVQDPEAA